MTRCGPLFALPLADWERDGLKAALAKAGLATDDVGDAGIMFWRYEIDDMPAGFAGLEVYGDVGLLRSVMTLPPLRRRGIGRAIVEVVETEAIARAVRGLYLLTTESASFFAALGYAPCSRDVVPAAIRATAQFASLCPQTAVVMRKDL